MQNQIVFLMKGYGAFCIGLGDSQRMPRVPDDMFGPGKIRYHDGNWIVPIEMRGVAVRFLLSAGDDVVEKCDEDETGTYYWRRVTE